MQPGSIKLFLANATLFTSLSEILDGGSACLTVSSNFEATCVRVSHLETLAQTSSRTARSNAAVSASGMTISSSDKRGIRRESPLMLFIVLVTSDQHQMGDKANNRWFNVLS